MNQKNVISSMIPRRMLEYIPVLEREAWADLVISRFEENNPELYASMALWRDIPEEELAAVQAAVIAAAEQVPLAADQVDMLRRE